MAFGEIVALLIVLYIVYKLVFDFVVPVAKTASRFKGQVNEMRRMQEEQQRRQQPQQEPQKPSQPVNISTKKDTTTTDGEYIDFEDVK